MSDFKDKVEKTGKLIVPTSELQRLLGCGRVNAVSIGDAASARIQIGRRFYWNLKKVQQYLDEISE